MRNRMIQWVALAACLMPASLTEARYYDSQTGRFLQEDPEQPGQVRVRNDKIRVIKPKPSLTDSQGWHSYNYTGNNPVNFIDPYGEQAIGACPTCFIPGLGTKVPPLLPLHELFLDADRECIGNLSDDDPPEDILRYCEQVCEPYRDDPDAYVDCLFRCFDSRN